MGTRIVWLLALLVLGCSGTPGGKVAKCEPAFTDFWSEEEHRAMAIHPRGCYASWDEPLSNLEAQRRALLLCSEANPDSDGRCVVIATDDQVCPTSLETWVKTQGGLHVRLTRKQLRNTIIGEGEEQCELGPAVEIKSPPGTEPPPVDSLDNVATKEVAAFFGLDDYDLGSSDFVTYRALYHLSGGFAAEALHFVERRDGKQTCILRAFSQWDPRNRELDTLFTVRLLGCFEM